MPAVFRPPLSELDALRRQGVLSAVAGFPILIVFAVVWMLAGIASYFVAKNVASWLYVGMGFPAVPVAIALERRLGYAPPPQPDPLFPLAMQLMFVQVVAFPAVLLVWDLAPHFVPVALAAVVGAHFLPYSWMYATRLYTVARDRRLRGSVPACRGVRAASVALYRTSCRRHPVRRGVGRPFPRALRLAGG